MGAIKRRVCSACIFALLVLSGLSAATQWYAAQYNYAPELGTPLSSAFGVSIYRPWDFLAWSRQFADQTTSTRAYSFVLLSGLLGLISIAGISALGAEKGHGDNVFGDASWALPVDIKKLGLLKGEGVFLGQMSDGRYLRHNGPEHCAVIAPTRSGKGAGIVIPTLLSWKESAIIYDLKEENYAKTSARRAQFSDVIYFNPKSVKSAHFNPLLEVREGINEVRDVQNIANMIIEPEIAGASDHWVRTGNSLLVAAILHVLYTASNGEKNLAGVTSFLSRATETLDNTLQQMLDTNHIRGPSGRPHHPHPHIQEAVRDVLNKSPDDRSSVHSTVMGYLSLYRDPLLADCTRDSDFCITDLVSAERPKSLYLVIPPADILRLRPIIRLIINQICRRLTEELPSERAIQRRHRLLLMLDEFPALGRLEFFESALGFIAGYGLKAMLICQSINQLKQAYGDRNSLFDNTHIKVFFTPSTPETAEYISRSLGTSTVKYRTEGESGQKGSPFFSGKSASMQIGQRPLMTVREVLDMPPSKELLLIGGARPIKCDRVTYYDDASLSQFIEAPISPNRDKIQAPPAASENSSWLVKYGDAVLADDAPQVAEDRKSLAEENVLEIEVIKPPEGPRWKKPGAQASSVSPEDDGNLV